MNFILLLVSLIAGGIVGWILWDKRKEKTKQEIIIVQYSEKVGDTIVEHDKQYKGIIDLTKDVFKIPALNLIKPIPFSNAFIPTRTGKKKVYLIKLDSFRFGFRIPSLDNEIYIQERDKHGNLIKVNGKAKLKKHKWKYCDDVVEPDVKHWDENIMEKLRQKHRNRADMLSKWIAPLVLGMLLVGGIVTIHLTTKYAGDRLDSIATLSDETATKVEKSSGLLDNLIKKVDQKTGNAGGS
jgi:hypothetical protein